MEIKIVFTDIDGVWTDGGMYYDEQGNEWKKFNTYDSAGVLFLRNAGIETVIITGENTEAVARRAKKLKIIHLIQGSTNKYDEVKTLCKKKNINLENVAYIGDDINDLECLKNLSWTASPKSAPAYIQKEVKWVMKKNGGEGAFREFTELILDEMGLFESMIQNGFR